MLVKMWSNKNSSLWVGMKNGIATFKDSSEFLYEIKCTLTMWFSNCYLVIYPKKLKTLSTQKTTYIFYSSFINTCQNLEVFKMSFSRWMNKQFICYKEMRYPSVGSRCSLVSEWINKLGYAIYLVKGNEISRTYGGNLNVY